MGFSTAAVTTGCKTLNIRLFSSSSWNNSGTLSGSRARRMLNYDEIWAWSNPRPIVSVSQDVFGLTDVRAHNLLRTSSNRQRERTSQFICHNFLYHIWYKMDDGQKSISLSIFIHVCSSKCWYYQTFWWTNMDHYNRENHDIPCKNYVRFMKAVTFITS